MVPFDRTRAAVLSRISHSGLRPPRMVTIMITKGCNLQCCHCWPESHPHNSASPVPKDTIMRLILECANLGVEDICLTGGEPLTHPAWFKILAFSCRQPGFKRVRLQTNATLLTKVEIKALHSISFKGLMVQVSLDGATAQSHDFVRGSGSFDRAFRGLKLLAEGGLGAQTLVSFTEMNHNFGDLPHLLEILDSLGIGGLVSKTLVLAGRAALTDQMELPTPPQYRELLKRYHFDAQFRERYKKLGNIAALEWLAGRSNSFAPGCICIETAYINADGQMYPCVMLPIDKFAACGVHNRSLEDVIIEALPLWAELPRLNRRRSVELDECKECLGRLHCAGGCMGRAYAATGDPMSVEDRCTLRKTVYSWNIPPKS